MSKIDLTAVWNDAKAMGAANRDLLGAVAGMFLLLPGLIAEQLVVMPEKLAEEPSNDMMVAWFTQYAQANWPVMLAFAIVSSFGILVMNALLLRSERLTVRESMQAALPILPVYVIANLLQSMGVMSGLLLFLIPGFYLIGRLALIAPVAAVERSSNPFVILRRSARLTRGNGWQIFGMMAIIFGMTFVIGIVAVMLIGVVVQFLLPTDLADLALALVSTLIETARAVLVALVCAALYRVTSRQSAP